MAINCRYCGGHHETAREVRACAGVPEPASERPLKPKPAPEPAKSSLRQVADPRPSSVSDVLVLLARALAVDPSESLLQAWARDPWTKRIIGYRAKLITEVAEGVSPSAPTHLPRAVAQELARRAKKTSNDSAALLSGRNEVRLSGGARPPVDAELHKRIGPIDNEP